MAEPSWRVFFEINPPLQGVSIVPAELPTRGPASLTVGRSKKATVQIVSEAESGPDLGKLISRIHARVKVQGGSAAKPATYLLADNESVNGLSINDVRADRTAFRELADGDTVRFGGCGSIRVGDPVQSKSGKKVELVCIFHVARCAVSSKHAASQHLSAKGKSKSKGSSGAGSAGGGRPKKPKNQTPASSLSNLQAQIQPQRHGQRQQQRKRPLPSSDDNEESLAEALANIADTAAQPSAQPLAHCTVPPRAKKVRGAAGAAAARVAAAAAAPAVLNAVGNGKQCRNTLIPTVGTVLHKEFKGYGWFDGKVTSTDGSKFIVEWSDDTITSMSAAQVLKYVVQDSHGGGELSDNDDGDDEAELQQEHDMSRQKLDDTTACFAELAGVVGQYLTTADAAATGSAPVLVPASIHGL